MVELTGLRNPCVQLERLQQALAAVLDRGSSGRLVRKAGVMAVVLAGDADGVMLPDPPHEPLAPV